MKMKTSMNRMKMKRSLASTELLISFLLLFILSTFACLIAGSEDDLDEHEPMILKLQGGPGYLDYKLFFCVFKIKLTSISVGGT